MSKPMNKQKQQKEAQRRRRPNIDSTAFGSITIDREQHPYDVVIRLSGKVVKRKKRLSKQLYGTSHMLSRDEAEFVFEPGCETLIIGAGQYGNVHLSPEAASFFAGQHCRVLVQPTPNAIETFNRAQGKVAGLFHVTC